ncbi:hypothetical protein FOA52_013890 [Chlamydomonas sp. UWO 241]|nr:hypothetical protein FOA52_013890 [Chlamydomonas sp. UWO 241]
MDLSRTRLNGPTPHQAPQREKISKELLPESMRPARRGGRGPRRWVDRLSPDVNMGVPQLMQILEPNIVWERTRGYCREVEKTVEASYCPGDFFEGWHRNGKTARGVYEGSYWELVGDADEMLDMLRKMAKAPPLLEEPPLELPEHATLPSWEGYRPALTPRPSAPTLPLLRLPPFRPPLLDADAPFLEPDYAPVPDVPAQPLQEQQPILFRPEELSAGAVNEPEFAQPDPPVGAPQPTEPRFGKPEHGWDWSGTRPYVKAQPQRSQPELMELGPGWLHPPAGMPKLPIPGDMAMEAPNMDLTPIPRFEVAWECGPQPEPSFSSRATSPTHSRGGSPGWSRPASAAVSSRPTSAALSSRPTSAGLARAPSAGLPRAPSAGLARIPSARESNGGSVSGEWSEVVDVDAGKPRLWMNFEAPFAELPPIFPPPEPPRDGNGPEPRREDFGPDDLEEAPEFSAPSARELPEWTQPQARLPSWMPPCEPRPVGFLRGTAPVLILDVSGTMNPRINGRFREMKDVVCSLLDPESGEIATAAGAFDVINFCSGAWSWSSTYAERMDLLQSSQIFYAGRQNGQRTAPGASRVSEKTRSGASLQPTEPAMLEDARNWVDKWPEAVGNTCMLGAFQTADEHWMADSWYIFSDGMADDPSQCVEFLEARIRQGRRVPVIHTVGFFQDGVNEHFSGRRYLQGLSSLTGGTFQEYDKNMSRVFQEGVGFVKYDLKVEALHDRVERQWAEEQLRAERRKNVRLGIVERLDVTLARVKAIHAQSRVAVAAAEAADADARARADHADAVADARAYNDGLVERTRAKHEAAMACVAARNDARAAAADAAFEAAHAEWADGYELAMAAWRAEVEALEVQRTQAQQALSRHGSRPTSASPRALLAQQALSRHGSRPTSASSRARPVSAARGGRPGSAISLTGSRPGSATERAAMASRPGSATKAGIIGASRPPSGRPPSASQRPASASGRPTSASGRPTSASGRPASASGRPASASRRAPVSGGGGGGGVSVVGEEDSYGDDAEFGIIQEEEGDELGELWDEPPPLGLDPEDSQELKRWMFPEEFVAAVDDENAAALDAIRAEWAKLLGDAEERNCRRHEIIERNRGACDQYAADVVEAYAASFVRDVVRVGALRGAANALCDAEADATHASACAAVDKENVRVAELHAAEVEAKNAAAAAWERSMARWREAKEEAARRYEAAVATARAKHGVAVAAARADHAERVSEFAAINAARLAEAERMHTEEVAEVAAANAQHRLDHTEQLRKRRGVEEYNAGLLGEARVQHRARLEQLASDNEAKLEAYQGEHRELCARLAVEHEVAKEQAQRDHDDLHAFLTRQHEEQMAEARAKFGDAIALARAEFEALCAELRAEHAAESERVRVHNADIWPHVQVARLAAAELARVATFAEHIRMCANKYGLGVNFMPGTPCYDRVVEMQALNEALARAYPDYPSPDTYPWPDHETKAAGTGWAPSPAAKPLNWEKQIGEVARYISDIALGKVAPPHLQNPRPASADPQRQRQQRPHSAAPLSGGSRPSSAFASPPTSSRRPPSARPTSAAPGSLAEAIASVTGGPPHAGAAATMANAMQRHSQQRPSTAHASLGGSARPESALRSRFSGLVGKPENDGLSSGLSSSLSHMTGEHQQQAPSPSLSPYLQQVGGGGKRPVSATARAAAVASRPASGSARPGSAGSRPASAAALSHQPVRQHNMPARVAAKLNNANAVLSAASAQAAQRPQATGFERDMPRLRHCEVDVEDLT